MVIPQFTLRRLLAIVTVCCLVFSVFGLALRGSAVAMGVSVAIVSLVVVALVHAALFAVVWMFSVLLPSMQSPPIGGKRGPMETEITERPALLE